MDQKTDITLYFLQASRSIRIAWLLEELELEYKSVFFPRENNKAPTDFKSQSGNTLGKAPCLKDGGLTIGESGAIMSACLIEKYDKEGKLMGGKDKEKRNRVKTFYSCCRRNFIVHCLAITYARWFAPESMKSSGDLKKLEEGVAINVGKDLDWLNSELDGKKFIAGEHVTAEDTMCLFSVQFIFARDLCSGRKVGEWKNLERWIADCEGTGTWKRAVKKTGHEM